MFLSSGGKAKRSRSKAVWFDPSTQAYKPKTKILKMNKTREASWLNGTRTTVHPFFNIEKANERKQNLEVSTIPMSEGISQRIDGNDGVLNKGLYGHFVMSQFGRLEQTDSPPPKLRMLNAPFPRAISVSPAANSKDLLFEKAAVHKKSTSKPSKAAVDKKKKKRAAVDKKSISKSSRNTVNSIPLLSPDTWLAPTLLLDSALMKKNDLKTPASAVSPLTLLPTSAKNFAELPYSSLLVSPFDMKSDSKPPMPAADLMELLFKSPSCDERSYAPLRDSPLKMKSNFKSTLSPVHSTEFIFSKNSKASFPLLLEDPFMPSLV